MKGRDSKLFKTFTFTLTNSLLSGRATDFDLTEEQKMFWESIADFCDHEIAPLVDEAEAKEEFPLPLFKKLGTMGALRAWRDSRVLSITEGTSGIQHLIIAGELKL